MKISKTKHIRVVKIVDDQLGPTKKDYSSLDISGTIPECEVFDNTNTKYASLSGKKIMVLVQVKDFRTFEPDDQLQNLYTFNRKINVNKSIDFLLRKEPDGSVSGFNYDYCSVIVGTLKFDSTLKEYYVFINQGQHRVAMAYLVMGEKAYIPVLLEIPSEKFTDEELLIHEARLHHVDAAIRTGQKITDKLRSAYICHDLEAQEIVEFYNKVGVNVANLLPFEKSCNSWGDIKSYIGDYGQKNTYRAMSAISEYCDEKTLHARAIGGLAALSFYFPEKIEEFEELNGVDFFKTVCRYAFKDRPRIVKMANLTKNSGNQKHIAWPMTLWINLVNGMIDELPLRKKGKGHFWITKSSKVWQNFLETNLGDDPLVEALNQKVEPNVI